jgi:hypothetical protein
VKLETRKNMKIPLVHRTANSISPEIVKASPGDQNFGLFLLPFCPNGSPVTSPALQCDQQTFITGFEVSVRQYYTQQTLQIPSNSVVSRLQLFY